VTSIKPERRVHMWIEKRTVFSDSRWQVWSDELIVKSG